MGAMPPPGQPGFAGVPQYGYQPRMTFGRWLGGWSKYYVVRFGVPVLVVLGCIWGYGKITQTVAHTVIGQWEVVDSSRDLVLVLNRDGSGWEFSGASSGMRAVDSDLHWTAQDRKLTVRFEDNPTPSVFGYAISDDGQQMSLRTDDGLIHYHRLEGEPPPRPAHINESPSRETTLPPMR